MNKILCSTGAIIGRPNGRNVKLLSDCIEQIHCDAYEFDFNLFFNYIQSQHYNGDYTIEATAFDRNGMIHFKELNACLKRLQELKS